MRHRVRTAPLSLLIGLLALCLFLAWLGLSYQFPHSEEESVSLANATSPVAVQVGKVAVKSWASREAVRSGDSFEVWVLVQNRSGNSLADLRIASFEAPGFVPVGTCWTSGVLGCRPGTPTASQPVGLDKDLPPQGVSMAFAELKSTGSKKANIVMEVAWTAEGRAQSKSIEIRPVKVVPRAPHWAVVGYSILKDLGLPLLLGVLAYSFQRVLQERSRDQTARQALLPTATTNAVKYLLPVSAAVRNLLRTSGEIQAAGGAINPETEAESFFYFVFTFKRMRDLVTVGGGFFLDNIEGEQLAATCWRAILRRAKKDFGAIDLSHLLDLMKGHETLSKFLDHLTPVGTTAPSPAQAAALRIRGKFLPWVTPGQQNVHLGVLKLMAEVLYLESNRLFLGWYDQVERPNQEMMKDWISAVTAFQTAYPDDVGELQAKLSDYLKSWPWWLRP